ncbi:MAG: hypothetical protein Q8Q06_00060, partial [bacterium]|nr:hypothetical protein [bacterium]
KDYEFPNITFGKPFEIPVKNPNNWGGISILNAPLIGLKHDRRIEKNPARRVLAEAERRKDEAVIIVNPIDINTKKSHGSARIHRAIVSGRNVNIKVLDPDYQEKARAVLDSERGDTLIYETYAEVLANIIAGWHKITHRPERLGGGPEYTGKVFVQFGYNEEEFIMAAASWDERYKTIQAQKRLDAEIVMAKSAKKRAEKYGDDEDIRFWSRELDKLVKERARTIISNISNEPTAKTVRKMRAFVVKMFEETIPNCTVIGQGSLYIKAGNKMIELNIPGHLNITDSLLSNYADNYGPNVLRGKFADIVVVCHPYSLGFRSTGREADKDGRRNSSEVFVAPAALDGAFLRDQLRASIRKVHPISKLIFNHQFSPGYMRLVCANGIVSGDFTSIDAIGAYKKYVNKEKLSEKKNFVNYEDCQFIWALNASDPHWGSRAKEYIWDKENQKYLGVCEAAIEMMRRAGLFKGGRMPVHMFNICDDPTQGNHYGTEKQPDINQMSYMLIENRWKEAVQKARARGVSTKDQLAILEEMRRLSLTQLHARGLDWLQHQIIEMLERHVAANVDFYDALLSRAFKAGIKAVGASYYRHEDFNTCDIGLINFGTGNHLAGTVDKTLTEGFLYADKARTELRALPRWRKEEKLLKELVQYPVHGNVAIGWGTIQAGKGYLWTIELRDSPTRLSSWGDTLQGWVRNDIKRANYSRFFDKGKTVKITGDKHFVGSVDTDWAFYHMCPAGTHTDTYGERGFPPNNTGVSFVGMPVNGPASGPMLVRTLRYDFLVKYFEKPFDFNWEKFLPNPA